MNEYANVKQTEADEELIGVLTAISVVSKRLAGKLIQQSQANKSQEGVKDNEQNERNGCYHDSDGVEYIIRRLTPVECGRLQGFPDAWCENIAIEEPTEEDMAFWRDVFETHRKAVGTSAKSKSDNQIRKWLKQPYSDSAAYRMWGNGISLPCGFFVLAGIAWAYSSES